MSNTEPWPPKSAHEALLSSPSGRRRLAEFKIGERASPDKHTRHMPSLLERLKVARSNNGYPQPERTEQGGGDNDNDEDDEEILQLELAAIEAKLRLKKIQRERKNEQSSVGSQHGSFATMTRPSSSSQIQVSLSPNKRQPVVTEQRSPSRVFLGIDKGLKATEISLRRAQTVSGSTARERQIDSHASGRSLSRNNSTKSSRPKVLAGPSIKSFSERMASSREDDRNQASQRSSALQRRAQSFKLDHAELSRYREAGGPQTDLEQLPPSGKTGSDKKAGDSLQASDGDADEIGQQPDVLRSFEDGGAPAGDAALFEGFSGLHLASRILPHSFLKRTLPPEDFRVYTIPDLLKDVVSPSYEVPDEVCDFVVFGVIASKSQPLNQKSRVDEKSKPADQWQDKWQDGTQNRKRFMAFTLTDLTWTIDLYLFDTAMPRYHRLSEGTVIAILNPTIMPPKKGREDTGAFSLALHNGDDTLLEIGQSRDLGYCKSIRKDGRECGSWVDASKTEICEFHLNMEIAKTQAKRMGVNSGTNGFGQHGSGNRKNAFDSRSRADGRGAGRGLLPAGEGRGFDRWTGTHYYVTSSSRSDTSLRITPRERANLSAARMLDLNVDDPFLAEGQLSRDREARLQKRMAAQEQERQIAKQLANWDQGGSAGAQYMRSAVDGKKDKPTSAGHAQLKSSADRNAADHSKLAPNSGLTDLKSRLGRKRVAEDVHLSPVKKKTRFLTSKGIREAGRASVGPRHSSGKNDLDDDDDDLDIV